MVDCGLGTLLASIGAATVVRVHQPLPRQREGADAARDSAAEPDVAVVQRHAVDLGGGDVYLC